MTVPSREALSSILPVPIPAVAAEHVSFSYGGCEDVLHDVSLTLRRGDFLAVIGPNGGGKSTLLRLILGLQKPLTGIIRVFGGDPALMSRRIGYVPQFSTMQQNFPASVLDVALMGAACPGIRAGSWPIDKTAKEKALTYLDILGLADCVRLPVGALSGGQRQRLLVVRALMGRPDKTGESYPAEEESGDFLLLLDEPTASIDPEGKFCFYEFIGKLRGRVSVIVVSHDLFMATPFFNHVLLVNKQVTPLYGNALNPRNLGALFERHLHDCPMGDLLHAGGVHHDNDCSHPVCRSTAEAVDRGYCTACNEANCKQSQCVRDLS